MSSRSVRRADAVPAGFATSARRHGRLGRAVVEAIEPRVLLSGSDPYINEFLASNKAGLADGNGDRSDWIEIHNPAAAAVDLTGYYLTDDAANLTKWRFPATTLAGNGYLVVFASDKAATYVGPQLHTNFKLGADGEYLGLVRPDGVTVASEFAPTFPVQQTDVSYGFAEGATDVTFVGPSTAGTYFVPTSATLPANYTKGYTGGTAFSDATWTAATNSAGYGGYPATTSTQSAMQNKNATVLLRMPFATSAGPTLAGLRLQVQYDDGFVAYLNGTEVARRNAPASALTGTSAATASHDGTVVETIDLGSRTSLLVNGTNVLAFHGLNSSAGSSDFYLNAQLVGSLPATTATTPGYLSSPTPGAANLVSGLNAGPAIESVAPSVAAPGDADNVVVTARVTPNGTSGVSSVTLRYRVNFGTEVAVTMADNGASGDGAAGDGVYGATIPASASGPGDMVRWYVSAADASSRTSRAPLFAAPTASSQYYGTVIANPAVTSTLPIVQLFPTSVTDMTASSRVGTRASVFYNGEFYDNVFIRDRGGNTSDGIKIDFNTDHEFLWRADGVRVSEVNLNYRSALDNSNVRAAVAFDAFRDAGVPTLAAAPWRIQVNGAFWHQATFVEQLDEEFLGRVGLDADGALYKADSDHATMTQARTPYYEKKTRKQESYADLQAFLDGIHGLKGQTAANYILDNFDVMGFANYWAVNTVVNDQDDVQKNFFLYRDTDGDGRWRFVPWDKDLTFGKNYGITDYASKDPQTHPFFGDRNHPKIDGPSAYNYLIDQLLAIPQVKQVYLRRLRSVMDRFLQPSGTPTANLYFENKLDAYYNLLAADPQVLAERGGAATFQAAINDIKTRYLAARRAHLYVDHSSNTAYPDFAGIPAAQAANPAVAIGAIDYLPASGDQDQEYIRLDNPGAAAVDVSGWTLSDAVRFTFAGGTVIPAGGSLYVARDLNGFRARTAGPGGNQGLLVVGGYDGQLSARGETIVLADAAGATVTSLTYAGAPTAAQQGLRVTEVMYHPAAAAGGAPVDDDMEYIELQNVSSQTLNLSGVRFTSGVGLTLGNVSLAPGAYGVVVRSTAGFQARYPNVPASAILGQYGPDVLGNGGENIEFVDAVGEVVQDFTYDDTWYPTTDGGGASLVIRDPAGPLASWDLAAGWRASTNANGSPGAADPTVAPPAIVAVAVNGGAAQRSMVTALTVTFDAAVSLDAGAFTLSGAAADGVVASPNNPSEDGRTWVISFAGGGTLAGSLADGIFQLTVIGSKVHAGSSAGPAMPADRVTAFHRLFGDADGDGDVDGADSRGFRTALGANPGDPNYNPIFDYDGDGDVDGADSRQFRTRLGSST